ncbi:MAG TPA: acyl carrier protein [Bacteroidales bacterium]|nr:acyl carrier protein [Bacteroidales bacterium]
MKEKLINALAEALEMDASKIKLEDKFRDYENYSSLTELSILAMMDSEFGIELEMKDFNNLTTVNDLLDYIEKNNK